MTRILAGYDFSPTEVPTREKFLEQARSLRVTELDQQILDASFGSILSADSSGATGGSAQPDGSLWVSPDGSIWAEYGRGPVKLWRADGGWETNRYDYLVGQGTTTPEQPGFGGDFGAGASENAVIPRAQAVRYDTGAGITLFVNAETAFSGGTRLLGRGVVIWGLEPTITVSEPAVRDQRSQLHITGIGVKQYWNEARIGNSDFRIFDGWVGGEMADTSRASVAGADTDKFHVALYGYWHQRMWGPGATP